MLRLRLIFTPLNHSHNGRFPTKSFTAAVVTALLTAVFKGAFDRASWVELA